MTMVQDPERALIEVAQQVGIPGSHAPYDAQSDVYCVWSPTGDEFVESAANRPLRLACSYTIAICARGEYTAIKLKMYRALRAAGFSIRGAGGEQYDNAAHLYIWPIRILCAMVPERSVNNA